MRWKKFLKPDWRKIIVFVVLFIIFSFLMNNTFYIEDKGFPFVYLDFPVYDPAMLPNGTLVDYRAPIFILINLILDIIFWYLLSCFIVWIYDKIRKKK